MRIEFRALRKTFPDGAVGLDGASLSLETPSFTVLSGRNGSGKSLLVRHALGLETADSGEVLVDGAPLGTALAATRRRVALVFQEPEHQILGVTVREDAEFGPRAARERPDAYSARVSAALKAAGLAGFEGRLCAGLSGGEKRRLAVASALVSEPELIVLDEPFNGLDLAGASDLLRVLLRLNAAGVGVLVVTHDLEKCLAHADRLVVLGSGRVVREGSPASLWEELPALGLRRPPGGLDRLAEMSWLETAP
ncbi:MAG: energy-coupling factor ABC transporter ATP-binding protein [Spirochaetes bacterium]|nr:energy-coupling factor ABC transporter ATP-binding protein [Spirochaetota bacterium]MBU1079914.1 energy-coupling factor ABC transporter ATP-binding protein [Spirochaetota bacterium]